MVVVVFSVVLNEMVAPDDSAVAIVVVVKLFLLQLYLQLLLLLLLSMSLLLLLFKQSKNSSIQRKCVCFEFLP